MSIFKDPSGCYMEGGHREARMQVRSYCHKASER